VVAEALPIVSIEADPSTACVSALRCADKEVAVCSSGCEFGDWLGFFSQAKGGGTNATVLSREVRVGPAQAAGRFVVQLPHGRWEFRGRDTVADGALLRHYELTAATESQLGDFVVRLALPKADWPLAMVGGRRRAHVGSNVMTQLPVPAAALAGRHLTLHTRIESCLAGGRWQRVTYVRDEPGGRWVVHHRLLPSRDDSDEYVLRVRHWVACGGARSWPACPPLRRGLWRFAERHPGCGPTVQIGGNLRMAAGDKLVLAVRTWLEQTGPA
jgi:hypothetical protein